MKINSKASNYVVIIQMIMFIQISAISKVVSPESAYLSIASTAESLSIRPHPPLVCHIPFTTLQMSKQSSPFFTTVLLLSSLTTHSTINGLLSLSLATLLVTLFAENLLSLNSPKMGWFSINNSAISNRKQSPKFAPRMNYVLICSSLPYIYSFFLKKKKAVPTSATSLGLF